MHFEASFRSYESGDPGTKGHPIGVKRPEAGARAEYYASLQLAWVEVLHHVPVGHHKAGEVGETEFWSLHAWQGDKDQDMVYYYYYQGAND